MATAIQQFWIDEQGQDFFEYTILIGVMVLGTVIYMTSQGSAVRPIWETANSKVQAAEIAVS